MVSTSNQERSKRLIVLLPDGLAGNLDLAREIFRIANPDSLDVLYLTLIDDDEQWVTISRRMATMKAVTSGNTLAVYSKLVETGTWLNTLKAILQPGDQVICHAEQSVKSGFLKTTPICAYLQKDLDVPVQVISGFYHPQNTQVKHWLSFFLAWIGFLAILAIFTPLEIQVEQNLQGFTHLALLIVMVTFEIGAIWAWNSLTRRS